MKVSHILLVISLLAPCGALAEEDSESMNPNCNNPTSTNELTICTATERESIEQEMNLEYERVLAALPKNQKAKLRAEQEIWLKSRERECEEETAESKGGAEWPIYYENCLKDSAKVRIGEIVNWAAFQKAAEPNNSFKADALRARP